jgi:hypothetical protein
MQNHDIADSPVRSRPMKLFRRFAVAAPFVVAVALAPASTAVAAGNEQAASTFRAADMDTTDCPIPTSELDCLGTHISAQLVNDKVGQTSQEGHIIQVSVFHVHEHANGTFDVDPQPFVTGQLDTPVRFRPLTSAHIVGSVPMSDGSTAVIDVLLQGDEPSFVAKFIGPFGEGLCPSGFAIGNNTFEQKEAIATGSATIEGGVQTPTTAVAPASLFVARSTGQCL